MIAAATSAAAKIQGKSKGKGKGKGKSVASKFQIMLAGKWENYGAQEHGILRRAYLVGHPFAMYRLRGQDYEYNFESMTQKNLATGKERTIRPPYGMRRPAEPLLPPGPMVVIKVPQASIGKICTINDPLNPGKTIQVAIPADAKPGADLAVPVPAKGESAQDVHRKQLGRGAKVALVGAAAGAGVVGGLVLGDHLAGGAVGAAVADSAAAEWAGGAVADAGEWVSGAAEDVGDWASGAAEDVGDWGAGAVEDVGDWGAGAAEDVGDFVMHLF